MAMKPNSAPTRFTSLLMTPLSWVGFQKNDETEDREEIDLVNWCDHNNILLNVNKANQLQEAEWSTCPYLHQWDEFDVVESFMF